MTHPTTDLRYPDAVVHFGVFFQGVNHSTIWSDPRSGSQLHPSTFTQLIQTAERGLFDAFFLGEGLRLREQRGKIHDLDIVGRPDALTELATLAGLTSRIGLVATQNTTYNDPADLARRLASLDVLSGGRAAWNVVTTDNAWTGANFRRGGYLDHADRYERAERFVNLAKAVWDSWDGTGFTPVTSRDRFFDVEITPTVPRSPQQHPVLFQAGDSPAGRDFATRTADVIFSRHGTHHADALEFADDIRRRTVAAGRPEGDVLILPGTQVVVADNEAEVEEKARWVLEQQVTPATALSLVGQVWGEDLSGYDPDGPLPAHDPVIEDIDGTRGAHRAGSNARDLARQWRAVAEENKFSLRELVLHHSSERGFAGTASQLADELTFWVRSGASDGFNITPYLVPSGLDDIVDQLVPALQDRGAYPSEYVGTTLREHLGLRPPLTRR
ncbi:NtaA/DmoA family FMN-dependent monooxygenase [Kineococcus sp. SYSU DK002]|uniref:NtaA/DmoA family FMN-dependent monooxygenase n=1 Tax=Kineococcus sp. SYSU DK002 TaxID=3383123 RepID=UPI003D7EE205